MTGAVPSKGRTVLKNCARRARDGRISAIVSLQVGAKISGLRHVEDLHIDGVERLSGVEYSVSCRIASRAGAYIIATAIAGDDVRARSAHRRLRNTACDPNFSVAHRHGDARSQSRSSRCIATACGLMAVDGRHRRMSSGVPDRCQAAIHDAPWLWPGGTSHIPRDCFREPLHARARNSRAWVRTSGRRRHLRRSPALPRSDRARPSRRTDLRTSVRSRAGGTRWRKAKRR